MVKINYKYLIIGLIVLIILTSLITFKSGLLAVSGIPEIRVPYVLKDPSDETLDIDKVVGISTWITGCCPKDCVSHASLIAGVTSVGIDLPTCEQLAFNENLKTWTIRELQEMDIKGIYSATIPIDVSFFQYGAETYIDIGCCTIFDSRTFYLEEVECTEDEHCGINIWDRKVLHCSPDNTCEKVTTYDELKNIIKISSFYQGLVILLLLTLILIGLILILKLKKRK